MNHWITKKRVVVPGGAGFLGSHRCERLLARGEDVLNLDHSFTGAKKNPAHLLETPYFELARHDVTFPPYVELDEIFNLACPASPIRYQVDPAQTTKSSVHGSINMHGRAKRVKARISQGSTSEGYGDPQVHPQPESDWGHVNLMGPRAFYDDGKHSAETLFFDCRRPHGLNVKVARSFNTYGPRMRPNGGRVVSNFIVQALRGEPITLYGDGTQSRSFCHVDYLMDGFLRLMGSPDELPSSVNLGNPGELSITELAEFVRDWTGSSSPLVHQPLPGDDPRQRKPDIRLARSVLGEPRVALAEGPKRTTDYFESVLSSGLSGRRQPAAGGPGGKDIQGGDV